MEHAQQVAFENSVDLSSDHCDSMWNDAQIAIENEMTDLYDSLQVCFEEWIAQLHAPSPEKQIYINGSNAKFLSYNNTRTLEDLYGIPEQRILHIHVEAGKDEKLVFGPRKNIDTLRKDHRPRTTCTIKASWMKRRRAVSTFMTRWHGTRCSPKSLLCESQLKR